MGISDFFKDAFKRVPDDVTDEMLDAAFNMTGSQDTLTKRGQNIKVDTRSAGIVPKPLSPSARLSEANRVINDSQRASKLEQKYVKKYFDSYSDIIKSASTKNKSDDKKAATSVDDATYLAKYTNQRGEQPWNKAEVLDIYQRPTEEKAGWTEQERLQWFRKIADRESSNRLDAISVDKKTKAKYYGLYQFGEARMSDHKRATGAKYSTSEFLKSEQLQKEVRDWSFKNSQESIKRNGLDRYLGTSVGAIHDVTVPGIIAMMHIMGSSGAVKYFKNDGRAGSDPKDQYGTKGSDYANAFANK